MINISALISFIYVLKNKEYLEDRRLILTCYGIGFVGRLFQLIMIVGIRGLQLFWVDIFFKGLLFGVIILAGIILANKSELPTFFNKKDKVLTQVLYGIGFGIAIGIVIYITNSIKATQFLANASEGTRELVNSFSNYQPRILSYIIVSLHEIITEESVYRLFIIPAVYVFLSQNDFNIKHKKKLVIAVILSSIAFGFFGTQSFVLAFSMGVVMSFVYLKYGFISVVLTHFVAEIFSIYSLLS